MALVFLAATLAWLAVFRAFPVLDDSDSYFHLALAREYARNGIPEGLPWAGLTPWASRYGDFQLLFHLYLMPFARGLDPQAGGGLALALLDGALFALLGFLGSRAIGRWGWLLPLAVYATTTEAALRLVRLRPELLALGLFLLAALFVARGRYRLLGVVAALFALAYSAVHAFLGLWLVLFVLSGWRDRRWEWALPLYAALGTVVGLVAHPQFPANLDSLVLVAQVPFVDAASLGSGTEIQPHTTRIALLSQLGFWCGAALVWLCRRPDPNGVPADAAPHRDVFGVLAAGFGGLYLLHARFALYAFPFAALWLLWQLRARGETLGPQARVFGRSVPTLVGVLVCATLAARPLALQAKLYTERAGAAAAQDRTALGAKIPAGARVAATWRTADLLVFYAPTARYLEVLDPLPLHLANPRAAATLRRVFAGDEPDTPLALAEILDSDHWVISRGKPDEAGAVVRLVGDPRFEILHDGGRVLARLVPGVNRDFVLDWQLVPTGTAWPVPAGTATTGWPRYPRHPAPHLRALEGFVDLARVTPAEGCVRLVHELPGGAAGRQRWELAAAGPTELFLDDKRVLAVPGNRGARLADAAVVELDLAADRPHRMLVETCAVERRPGFYLRAFRP
ncbi:MAG: hypothetical protein SF066_18920 [Thermoanaerobaculia bacterium]|nr:hypothetical protein [Thermoanaerobaculia bacterium]